MTIRIRAYCFGPTPPGHEDAQPIVLAIRCQVEGCMAAISQMVGTYEGIVL